MFDEAQIVTSWASEGVFDDEEVLRQLKEFLCRMGREANQGEIGIVIEGTYVGIVDFYEEGGA